MDFLHPFHPVSRHRGRQIRWVLPTLIFLVVAVAIAMGSLYYIGNQDVGTEFWSAHKQISHTGQLLNRGVLYGMIALVVMLIFVGYWAMHVSSRIVRPVHTLHLALESLVTGDLGVRLEFHRRDEFQEVGSALNHLVEEFSKTLNRVHDLVDRIEDLAKEGAEGAGDASAEVRLHALAKELNGTMEFFRLEPIITIRENG